MQVSDIYSAAHDYKEKIKKISDDLKLILAVDHKFATTHPDFRIGNRKTFGNENEWLSGRTFYVPSYDLKELRGTGINENVQILKKMFNLTTEEVPTDILSCEPLISTKIQKGLRIHSLPDTSTCAQTDTAEKTKRMQDKEDRKMKTLAMGALEKITKEPSLNSSELASNQMIILRQQITELLAHATKLKRLAGEASYAFENISEPNPNSMQSPSKRMLELKSHYETVYTGSNHNSTKKMEEIEKLLNSYILAQSTIRECKRMVFTDTSSHDFIIMELIMRNERDHIDFWTRKELDSGRGFLRERVELLEGKDNVSIALRDLYKRMLSLETVLGDQIASRDGLALKKYADARKCAPSEFEYRYLQFVYRKFF